MRKHWTIVAVGLVMSALALTAFGCSSSSSKSSATPTQPIDTPVSTQGTTPQPTSSGTAGGPTSPPSAFTTVVATQNAALGTILTTYDGYTLYTSDNDTGGVSACTGACANLWPPLVVPGTPTAGAGVSGTLGQTARPDGTQQVTYGGKPLYLYSSDPAKGDTNGDGFANGVWHVVKLGG